MVIFAYIQNIIIIQMFSVHFVINTDFFHVYRYIASTMLGFILRIIVYNYMHNHLSCYLKLEYIEKLFT